MQLPQVFAKELKVVPAGHVSHLFVFVLSEPLVQATPHVPLLPIWAPLLHVVVSDAG